MSDLNPDAKADTPSGIPLGVPGGDTAQYIQDTVMSTLADVFSNPVNNPLVQAGKSAAVGAVQSIATPEPGRSATYYYLWSGGLVTASAANFYAAYTLPPEQKLLRALAFLQGTAFVAAAAVDFQKARKVV